MKRFIAATHANALSRRFGTLPVNGSLYFNGSSYLTQTNADPIVGWGTGQLYTIEMFVYLPSSPSANAYILQFPSPGGLSIYINSTGKPVVTTSAATYTSASAFPTGVWTHLAVCRYGTSPSMNVTLYVGGTPVVTSSSPDASYILTGRPITIGATTTGSSPFNGYITNLRFNIAIAGYPDGIGFSPPTSSLTDVAGYTAFLMLAAPAAPFLDSKSEFTVFSNTGGVASSTSSPFS